MTRHLRAITGVVLLGFGLTAIGAADATTPTPDTGQAVTSIHLPSITVTDAAGGTHTVDLGALTATALTDTNLLASLGVDGGNLLGASLPGWAVDTSGGPQNSDHDISLTNGSAAADVDLIGYDVDASGQAAHSSLDSLTGTATTTPVTVHVDLGQHGVDSTVQPDTSTSTVNLTVTGLQIGMGDLLAIVTETVFQWPGMGLLFTNAVGYPDVPVLSAYLLFVGFLFVMINMIVDILYTFIDPRLRTA